MGSATLRPRHLQSLVRESEVDVVHYPLTVPIPRPMMPYVTTLHDVQHLDMPELFGRGERLFRRIAYDRTSRRASAVIVVSDFVQERVVELLGLDAARVHTVWQGVDHGRFAPAPDVDASRSCCTRRGRGRTRIMHACSRRSPRSDVGDPSSVFC